MSGLKRITALITVLLLVFGNTAVFPSVALDSDRNTDALLHGEDQIAEMQGSLPSAVTLVGTTHLPPIGNQGAVGCCASMAATYMQYTNAYSRYVHSIDPNSTFNPSCGKLQYNFSPRFTYNLAGSGTAWVYEVLKEQGTVLQTYSTFSGGVTGAAANNALAKDWATIDGYWTEAMKYRINNYDQVWMSGYDFQLTTTTKGKALLNRIKSSLNDGNVVVTGGYPDRWDYTTAVNGGTYGKKGEQVIYRSTNRSSGGHQVSIVGYDDNLTCTVNGITLKGAFLVANSWGTTWKNGGYTWVMYDAVNQTSAYSALNHTDRQWTLDQFVFLDWKTDLQLTRPALSAKLEIETADRNGFSVTMTRTDAKGNTERYIPYIVRNENLMPEYDKGLNFYGRTGLAKGYLNYNFATLLDLPAGTDYDDYIWGVTVTADSGKTLNVGKVQLLDQNGEVVYTVNANENLSSGQQSDYLFSNLCIVTTDLVDGTVMETVKSSSFCEKGSEFSFTVKPAAGFTESNLRVSANGVDIYPTDGVYTLTVNDHTEIRVTGICAQSNTISTGWYGTGFENWGGKYLMLLMVENLYLDPDVFASEAQLNNGTYPYYFRVTVNAKEIYYFTPSSFYYFDASTLYRLPVVEQGWIPQNGQSYQLTIEVCTEDDILYRATATAKCKVSIEQSYTPHTHSYTGSKHMLTHAADCSHTGSYDQLCATAGCRAAATRALEKDASVHSKRHSTTVPATVFETGSHSVYCSHCNKLLSEITLPKLFPTTYDLDDSGVINIADVNLMLSYLATAEESASTEELAKYDLDDDGFVAISDLNLLLVYLSTAQ